MLKIMNINCVLLFTKVVKC